MTRRTPFWILLAILGLAGSVVAYRLFPVAFPILAVDIEMDREEAMAQARALADRLEWGPSGFRQAASFRQRNPAFQTYMELEGGGLDHLNRLIREGAFDLYSWRVRHFAPGMVEEAEIRFTPSGQLLGFRLRLSEDAPGETLSPDSALTLALAEATRNWAIDFSRYELLESTQEEKPGGRRDHTFVFEQADLGLGEANARLRLGVAGDRLVEVRPFFYVPEGFLRRYQDTRNANESISLVGTVVFLLLFLAVGGGVGAVHLLRQRLVEWKAPLLWGVLVAGLMALGSVNSLPLSWMTYDTALPPSVYVATILLTALVTLVAGAVLLAVVFMVGEGLLRMGFEGEIQLWKTWSPGVANSPPVLGRFLAPYLILGVQLAYVIGFYLVMSRTFGWWSPASALADPDLLATHFPWLTAVATSLFAAFSEETIFRAIPIGAAAFIGKRRGQPGLWIWGAVILQAVVFGASHANYPQQPAYARVVEISPVYLAWGAITVFFGLVPAIIGHFTYNLVLFSLPLFAAETSGIWMDRGIVIAAGVLPLAVVLGMRLRHGMVDQVPEKALNRGWRSPEPPGRDREKEDSVPEEAESHESTAMEGSKGAVPLPSWATPTTFVGAVLGLIFWVTGLPTVAPPRLSSNRAQVIEAAQAYLSETHGELGADWMPLVSVTTGRDLAHDFAWQEGEEEDYEDLLGTFLASPQWRVRFINFQLPPEDRAEAWTVSLSPDGRPLEVRHALPEGREGENLSEAQARALALETLQDRWQVEVGEVREISAEETARPNRTDWTFSFSASDDYPLTLGEGRLEVQIAGGEVVDARRYVHVPEEWERTRRADQSRRTLASIPFAAIALLLALAALVQAVVKWARGSLNTRWVRVLTPTLALLLLATALNEWPNVQSSFTTQLSFGNQAGVFLLGMVLGVVFLAVGSGLVGGLARTWLGTSTPTSASGSVWIGMGLGFLGIGVLNILARLGTRGPPSWPDFAGATTYSPWLSQVLSGVVGFFLLAVGLLMLLATLEWLRDGRWAWMGIPLLLTLGLLVIPNNAGSSWFLWIEGGVGFGLALAILWAIARRVGWAVVPGVALALVILGAVETSLFRPFPGAALGAWLGVALAALAALRWARAL